MDYGFMIMSASQRRIVSEGDPADHAYRFIGGKISAKKRSSVGISP
jgi:hypothetical protein